MADAMLERLARWLRALGYDVARAPAADDATLVACAVRERRVLLTRDRGLSERCWLDAIAVVEARRPREQLREVIARLGLHPGARRFTRCLVCNALLEAVHVEAGSGRTPGRPEGLDG